MKYILTIFLSCLVLIGSAQQRRDTTTPPHGGMPYPDPMQPLPKDTTKRVFSFNDVVFLMQQNMELSQRLDKIENRLQQLENELHPPTQPYGSLPGYLQGLFERMSILETRPIIYIDTFHQELWVKCPDGSCDIFIRKL